MSPAKSLKVTSHVGRDLLASAASFKTEAAAVWEYVVNSLQYVDDGVSPKVQVFVNPRLKVIEVRDNGRGMHADGLRQYFTMHGENIDRLRGRPGRGKFGTGKSAGFGIGKFLRIDTRRNGLRNVVELDRDTIEASKGDDVDLNWVVRDEAIDFANGTTVTIGEIFLPKLSISPIIEYIERHLQVFRGLMPQVAVNEHVCQYREPTVAEKFTYSPSAKQAEVLGNVQLVVKVSTTPLPSAEQGIAVTAGLGNLIAIETGGIEKKELGNYLFGEIDVPTLESLKSPIEPYDTTRSLQLNPQHPVVRVLIPFIGSKLEEARRTLLEKLNEARKTEEARRLALAANKIAEILNQDFKNVIGRLQDIRSASARPGDLRANLGNSLHADNGDVGWIEGTTIPGELEESKGQHGKLRKRKVRPSPEIVRRGIPTDDGTISLDPSAETRQKARRPRGGFSVEYRNLGLEADRSKYDRTNLSILINLDHSVVRNALRAGGVEDLHFRRLSYEIAFTEYSIALGYEMAEQDPDIPADDLLFEVRTTLNRISASAASLYS
jgi:Histidine kinase-, DNA gyrase B-, and HSP90-like ATPase